VLQAGILGEVRDVYMWMNHPVGMWLQGNAARKALEGPADPVPAGLDWDLWLGICTARPYKHTLLSDDPHVNERYDKSRILPTRADSLLRAALESTTGEYSLSNTKPLKSEAAMFSSPMHGNISRNFDAPESSFDVAIMSINGDDSVMAVENGTVIAIENQAEGLRSITIHHNGGYISVYKNLGEILVRKGQTVQSGSVIGRLSSHEESRETNLELGFELWRDGTAVDPERYILF
jgi:hypothetical protein